MSDKMKQNAAELWKGRWEEAERIERLQIARAKEAEAELKKLRE